MLAGWHKRARKRQATATTHNNNQQSLFIISCWSCSWDPKCHIESLYNILFIISKMFCSHTYGITTDTYNSLHYHARRRDEELSLSVIRF